MKLAHRNMFAYRLFNIVDENISLEEFKRENQEYEQGEVYCFCFDFLQKTDSWHKCTMHPRSE